MIKLTRRLEMITTAHVEDARTMGYGDIYVLLDRQLTPEEIERLEAQNVGVYEFPTKNRRYMLTYYPPSA